MSGTVPNDLTIGQLSQLIQSRKLSAVEVTTSCLARIEGAQKATNAFVVFDDAKAVTAASKLDERAAKGDIAGPLHGIPIAVKDNYWTAEYPTTAGSAIYPDNPPNQDATVVARLRAAGAIVIGKTNMHEWAYGATNEVSAYGPTRNPWSVNHITGGSSGGSGAALAARMVPGALGSDTGGSVRIPAAACGVCGLKPTYGRVSKYGVLPLSWSLDVAGPMARSAEDLGILFRVMAGEDPKDRATLLPRTPSTGASFVSDKPRVGILRSGELNCDPEILGAVEAALGLLSDSGVEIEEIEFPDLAAGFGVWKVILHAEAASYHAKFLEDEPEKYSDNVRMQIEAGRCIPAANYMKAQQFRSRFNEACARLFERFDFIASPALPVVAPEIGQQEIDVGGVRITSQDAMTSIAWIANITGFPAISLPCGQGPHNLPIGLMLMGPGFGEELLLGIAQRYQELSDWHRLSPAMVQ